MPFRTVKRLAPAFARFAIHVLTCSRRILALSHTERLTILGVLDNPPLSLSEFRGALMKDA